MSIFPPIQTGPGAHPASCTMGTASFPGVKSGRSVLLTTQTLLALRSWKCRAIPLTPLGHNQACNGVTLLYFYSCLLAAESNPEPGWFCKDYVNKIVPVGYLKFNYWATLCHTPLQRWLQIHGFESLKLNKVNSFALREPVLLQQLTSVLEKTSFIHCCSQM